MEFKGLDKKVISYWMIWRLVLLLIMTAGIIVGIFFIPQDYILVLLVPTVPLWLLTGFYALILPRMQQKVYKYYVDNDKVVISRGVIFRKYKITPIVQVQDIGSTQGPIQILFKLSNVMLSTAGSTEVIECLNCDIAKKIVDDIQVKVKQRLTKENNDATL